jgi:hypothetical protein
MILARSPSSVRIACSSKLDITLPHYATSMVLADRRELGAQSVAIRDMRFLRVLEMRQ